MKYTFIAISCIFILFFSCDNITQIKQESIISNSVLKTLNHQRYYLNQHKGQVSVLIFWSTWCTICKKELIAFESYKNQLQYDKLNVVAVCFDPEEIDKVKNIVKHLDISYPILLDEGAELYNCFQTKIAPITVIVNTDGGVDLVFEGFSEQIMRKMTSRIEVLLEAHE